jgi:hypothetical protein
MLGSIARLRGPLVAVALGLSGGVSCGYHVGRPPIDAGFVVGRVVAPVVEPEIAETVASALAASLRRLGATGEIVLDARVTKTDWSPAAASGGSVSAWEASLEIEYSQRSGERVLQTRRRTVVAALGADPARLNSLRTDTFSMLARSSADEAASWFAYAPEGR